MNRNSASKSKIDLVSEQHNVIDSILELADQDDPEQLGVGDTPWKILVFDNYTQQLLSTLVKVGDLREKKITLHLGIDQLNEEIHGIKAILFISPTLQNIDKIGRIVKKGYLTKISLIFVGAFEDQEAMLNRLAELCGNKAGVIQKLLVYNLNFIVLNKDMFTLGDKLMIDQYEGNDIGSRLLSSLEFFGINPLILSQDDDKVNSFVTSLKQKTAKKPQNSKENGVLIIYSRGFDPALALHHSALYQALITEEYSLEFNKASGSDGEFHDLDVRKDDFWQRNHDKHISEVLPDIRETIALWNKEFEGISKRKVTDDMKEFTDSVVNALELVPEMNDKKKRNESHLSILQTISKSVKARRLDEFSNCELSLLQGTVLKGEERESFEALISLDSKSDERLTFDKLRLLLIFLFSSDRLDKQEMTRVLQIILSTSYIKPEYKKALEDIVAAKSQNKNNIDQGFLNNFATRSMKVFSRLLRGSEGSKIEGVLQEVSRKNLELEGFSLTGLHRESVDKQSLNVEKIILFCIDHGSYVEYDSISKFASTLSGSVLYGAARMSSSQAILESLLEK